MLARRKSFWCKRMAVWQILFCLTVVAFLYRALIPVGYMPDLSGERNSRFAITLCTMGASPAVVQLDFSDSDASTAPADEYSGNDCPFGLNVAQKLLAPDEPPVLQRPPALLSASLAPRHQARPPLPALGPPLGSRAPPMNLG